MKCDKLFKEAFEGIEFRYKLDDTLEGLGSQKFTAKQLEGYLLGKGISPKEIKQSGIFEGMMDDNRALPADMWLENTFAERQTINTFNVAPYDTQYRDYSLGKKAVDNETYKETLSTIAKPKNNAPDTPHFRDEINTRKESLLGWRRTHIDEINGKKTLVLNEFQSDWAQTERAGRGMFESNMPSKDQVIEAENLVRNYLKDNNITINDVIQGKVKLPPDIAKADKLVENYDKTKVTDFPMSEVKHHQFQIVGAINDAIKEGIDTVAIPIQRENELMGGPGVTKFYESLNTKVLPDIRKKLEKQGLKIKVDKKPYKTINISKQEQDSIVLDAYNKLNIEAKGYLDWSEIDSLDTLYNKLATIDNTNNSFSNSVDLGEDFYKLYNQGVDNDLWTLTIEEVPNGKVKWDVYSILAALGLGGYATQSEANTKVSKEPSQEGKFGLAKRVGSKLNYNESDTEIADYFASIESGGNYNARNKGSSAFGKYQVIKSTLAEKAKDLGISIKEARTPEGQEMVMHSLLSDYKSRLKEFDLPVTKENMFVLHNLGQTGGVRVLRGTYTGEDIGAMRRNVSTEERKLPNDKLVKAYTERYNINIPPKQES